MNTKNWTSGTFATYLQTWLALPCLLDSKSEVDIRRSRILLSHIHFNRRWRCDASTKKNHHPVSSNTQSRITYSRMRGGGFCTARLNVTKQSLSHYQPTLQQSPQSLLFSTNKGISISLWILLLLAWVILIWRKDWNSIICFMLVITMCLPIHKYSTTYQSNTTVCLNNGWPTRWHLLYYILLNMFQTLIRPSSGASEYLLCCLGCNDRGFLC